MDFICTIFVFYLIHFNYSFTFDFDIQLVGLFFILFTYFHFP